VPTLGTLPGLYPHIKPHPLRAHPAGAVQAAGKDHFFFERKAGQVVRGKIGRQGLLIQPHPQNHKKKERDNQSKQVLTIYLSCGWRTK
jgi:hypothetical protein